MLEGACGLPFVTCPDVVDGPAGPGLPLPSQVRPLARLEMPPAWGGPFTSRLTNPCKMV